MYAYTYVNVYAYVCHEGSETFGVFKRKTNISYWWHSRIFRRRQGLTTSRGDTDGIILPMMLTRPNQAGLGRIDATRGIMYVVNSESRFRVSRVPITRGSGSIPRFSSDVCGGSADVRGRGMKCDGGARAINVIHAVDEETCCDFPINTKLGDMYGKWK